MMIQIATDKDCDSAEFEFAEMQLRAALKARRLNGHGREHGGLLVHSSTFSLFDLLSF